MIHSLGLGGYYERKAGVVTAKVDPNVFVIEELFKECVTENPSGTHTVVFYITSVRCAACVWLVENIIKKQSGVLSVRVNYATYRTVLEYDPAKTTLKTILLSIAKAGYPPVATNPVVSNKEKKDLFTRFAVGSFFTMQLMMYSFALYAGYFNDMPPTTKLVLQVISWILATPVLLYTGKPFFQNALRSLRSFHTSMDLLVALGSGTAYIYSVAAIFLSREVYFDTSATIITLIMLGRYLDIAARHRAKSGLLSLFSLMPMFARLKGAGDVYAVVPVGQVKQDDILRVTAGDRVPVDGVVISGNAAVDESMLTGEPIAAGKSENDSVYAGTLNTDGLIEIRAVSVGKTTVLSKIIAAIEASDISKTRLINIVDKISGIFIPFVLIISLLTFAVHFYLSGGVYEALMSAVSVLVIACPCALGVAAPLAINEASSRAVNIGALVKNGDAFELLSKLNVICLDKTGTLTEGKPKIAEYKAFIDEKKFLSLSAAAENCSNHLLAKTISTFSPPAEHKIISFTEKQGKGVHVSLESGGECYDLAVGRFDYVKEYAKEPFKRAESGGKTEVYTVINGECAGFYLITDPLRSEAEEVIKKLAKRYRVELLSGDNEGALASVSEKVGGISYKAGLSPFDKTDIVSAYQKEKNIVAMVGDGINDALALKEASVGVAVGQKASDIAVESADIVLVRPDLRIFERMLTLSNKTVKTIKQNLAWAFSYNLVAIPMAAMGILHPIVSAISMITSSLIVVINSGRIRKSA
jgi:heavy metal translocating P-type ATPase